MKVVRYSFQGFKPQFQSYHKKLMDWDLNVTPREFLRMFSDYDRYAKKDSWKRILAHKAFVKEHYLNNLYGVWVFVEGHVNKQSLNHLKRPTPCWSAELPDDTLCYLTSNMWVGKLSDEEATYFGVFVPASQLNKIKNIKRIK